MPRIPYDGQIMFTQLDYEYVTKHFATCDEAIIIHLRKDSEYYPTDYDLIHDDDPNDRITEQGVKLLEGLTKLKRANPVAYREAMKELISLLGPEGNDTNG